MNLSLVEFSSETIEDKRSGLHGILFRVALVILVLEKFLQSI